MKRTILKIVGYTTFFLFALLLFMYWTFPMDKVRVWVEQKALEKLKLDVSIEELDLAGLNGFEATGVVLRLRAKKAEAKAPMPGASPVAAGASGDAGGEAVTGGEDAPAPVEAPEPAKKRPAWHQIRIDRLEAHVSLWDVLFSDRIDVLADLEALGGRVQGLHVQSDEGRKHWRMEVAKIADVQLAPLPIEDWIGADLQGSVNGTVSVELGKDVFTSRGVADLELDAMKFPSPELEQKLYGEVQKFVLSDIDLGTVKLEVTLDRKGNIPALGAKSADRSTVIHFATVQVSGGDVEIGLDERSTLSLAKGQGLDGAYMSIHGSFHIKPEFFERQVRQGGEMEKPNLFLRTLLQGDRKWRQAERDGLYGFRCVGPFAAKSCSPTTPPGRGRYTPTARKKLVGSGEADEPDEAGASPAAVPPDSPASPDRADRDAARRLRMLGDREGAKDRARPGFIKDRTPPGMREDGRAPVGARGGGDDDEEDKIVPIHRPDPVPPGEPAEPEEVVEEPVDEGVPVDDGVPVEEGVEEPGEVPAEEGEPVEEGRPAEEEPIPYDDMPPPDDYQRY